MAQPQYPLWVGDSPMSFVTHNGVVYYTNGTVIGYIKNGQGYNFDTPTAKYKSAPPPGQIIGYYNGALYICQKNVLWVTDTLAMNQVDMRNGYKQFPADITMFAPVDDGIFISTTEKVYWLGGLNPDKMYWREIYDKPVIKGAWTYVDSRLFGKRKLDFMQGKTIVMYTNGGLCWGTNNGIFGNISARKYRGPSGMPRGAAIFVRGSINKAIIAFP